MAGLAAAFVAGACAQSIAFAPQSPSIGVKSTVQFTAHVSGGLSSAVQWSVAGVTGGNGTNGTISQNGLYTAPASLPAQNPVTVTVTSVANPSVSASTFVTILAAGPTVTSVSPNPLPTGSYTVTIQGSGFQPYAVVLNTSNKQTIQLGADSVTPTTIVASGWQANASSAVFSVKNPGSVASNSITVPVVSSTPTFALTVANGSGGGSYAAGTVVTVTANTPPAGQKFTGWTGATVANPASVTTTLVMPASSVALAANYSSSTAMSYALTVVGGAGSGTYAAGATVTITANAPPAGQAFVNWTGAAVGNAASMSTSLTMPAAPTTVTANYTTGANLYNLTVNNGSGSGNYAAGTQVTITANAAPLGLAFSGWSGQQVANTNATTTTLIMPAWTTTVSASFYPIPNAIPFPVTTHPRVWITTSDVPRLQSWATSSNPVYQNGLLPVLQKAVSDYETQFFPGGVANPNYPDPGDVQGYTGILTEQTAVVLALNSLIDSSAANRIKYAQYARNLLMYAMNQAALGHAANLPFRDPAFAVYNRANGSGEQWPLIVDWIYSAVDAQGQPILTSADKRTIRNVFLMWANDCINASTTGGDHPVPIGATNTTQLLPNQLPYRLAANNYYSGHVRELTMMSLAIDPADDPALDPARPPQVLGNSLRSYIANATGSWLYQQWAMYGEPAAVASAYGIPGGGAGFGLASGGLPPEGMLYGVSYATVLGELLALQTAGFNNPSYAGPQIAMINTPMWDRFVRGVFTSLTPAPKTFSGSESYLGDVYQLTTYGDLLRFFVTPDYMAPFALLSLLEGQQGSTAHLTEARWFSYNVVQGGPAAFYQRMLTPYSITHTLLYFLLFDPAVNPASIPDPRPGYPTTFIDAPQSRLVSHSDWSQNGTMFDYKATWESINHQDGNAGQFELFRKGEWLTRELSNYDDHGLGLTCYYHNTLCLQNTSPDGNPQVGYFEAGELAKGGQWILAENAGDPTTQFSKGTGYYYANSDLTKLYNRPNPWTPSASIDNITQATRSILWLNNDYIVVYDRATSKNAGLFKRFNLTLLTNPTIAGNTLTETLPGGQQLFLQSLLPANAAITARNTAGDLTTVAELEPAQYVATVQDSSNPADTRFLHVLQGADSGVAMVHAVRVQSNAGAAFDGAAFGSNAVYFPVTAAPGISSTTLSAPSDVHTAYITGLTPNAGYSVNVQTNSGGSTLVVNANAAGSLTDAAGVLRIAF